MITDQQREEFEAKYKEKISFLTRKLVLYIDAAMAEFYKEYNEENNRIVIAASHKALYWMYEGSCCTLVENMQQEQKEEAIKVICEQIDSIKHTVKNV